MIDSLFYLGSCLVALGGGGPCSPAEAPASLTIATSRGESVVPVLNHFGHPAIAAPHLGSALPVTFSFESGGWVRVAFAGEPFRFLLDAPLMEHRDRMMHLVGGAYTSGDTLYVPLQWLSEVIPSVFSEGYSYDPVAARFEEVGTVPVITTVSSSAALLNPVPAPSSGQPRPAVPEPNEFGLRFPHTVAIDPGHGGVDRGNPGLYLPRGVSEKHITLAIGLELKRALERRNINVIMTRTTDRRVDLSDRSTLCVGDCELFVSVHLDALPEGPGYTRASGIHTYIWGGSQSANARRVAAMANQALQYEVAQNTQNDEELDFIMRDLQMNEHQRESSVLATVVQHMAASVHPGNDRGVEQANYAVLRTARRPAILIETGFASNQRDARFLTSTQGQRSLAEAIAEGIVEYLRVYESKLSTP